MSATDRRELIESAATDVFGERGYHGASMEEIASRSGVTVPVVYDHVSSKRKLYERLIARHYAALRAIWFEHARDDRSADRWIADAIDTWFVYVQRNPFAGRMLFRDTTGDVEIDAVHREIQRTSREELLPLVEHAVAGRRTSADRLDDELIWETFRAVLQGLAQWWYEHPDVPRERIVASAMNSIWIGFDRYLRGDAWTGGAGSPTRDDELDRRVGQCRDRVAADHG